MDKESFYTPPPDEIFDELLSLSVERWKSYDDTHWYATEKIERIKELPNVSSNFMTMWQMFDINNQNLILNKASWLLIREIRDRTVQF